MKDDNYIRQKIIDLHFNKNWPVFALVRETGKSVEFVERVIAKHEDFIKKQ